MRVVRTIGELRALLAPERRAGRTIGFVPTMGAFHDGHLSLMRRARERCDVVVTSLFVNPTQFNDAADLDAYPRDEARDARMAEAVGVDLLFAPGVAELYPPGFATRVVVRGVSEPLEGAQRGPGHFAGVATVVAKLLNIVGPDVAFFGQKDAQQALVVRRLARDLDLPVEIEVCPTVREPDGLAMSSRNVRLVGPARAQALALRRGLDAAERAVRDGERSAGRVEAAGRAAMAALDVEPEYFAVASADTLAPMDGTLHGEVLVAVAARVAGVRLIDNVLLRIE
ncbi:MAG TPA: pantoate--beta-alanine ligase [Gemmatimonadaceae bacterium]|nr:pantoate--beta-alanine ligase [Gemmatimonadaceae bacterium]